MVTRTIRNRFWLPKYSRVQNGKTPRKLTCVYQSQWILLKRLIQSLPFVCTSVYESTMFASAFSLCFFRTSPVNLVVGNCQIWSIKVIRTKFMLISCRSWIMNLSENRVLNSSICVLITSNLIWKWPIFLKIDQEIHYGGAHRK